MFKRILLGLVVATVCSATGFAQQIVFDNFAGLEASDTSLNDLSATIGGVVVDDFSLASTTQIAGVQWRGVYIRDGLAGGDGAVAASDDNFQIRIYADNAGAPDISASQVFNVGSNVNRSNAPSVPIGLFGASLPSFNYSAAINFTADAGETYWLSILNDTQTDPDISAQLAFGSGGNAFVDLFPPNDVTFIPQTFSVDFQLVAVPEPSSAALLVLGLAGLVVRRRRAS